MSELLSPLKPALPTNAGEIHRWGRLYGSSAALSIVSAANHHQGLLLVMVADEQQAWWLESELGFFAAEQQLPIVHFPDWETLPYDLFSPHQDIVSDRLKTLHTLNEMKRGILIVTASAMMQRLAPREYLDANIFMLGTGDTLDIDAVRKRLEQAGYECVSQVYEHGQFAVRGSLFDVFPMGSNSPYRIDLFDDEIESIKQFDPETQRSSTQVKRLQMLPGREFPLSAESVKEFKNRFRQRFAERDLQRNTIYTELNAHNAPGGVEYYLPLFFNEAATVFDYLPANTLCLQFGHIADAIEQEWARIGERFEQRNLDVDWTLLPPDDLYLRPSALLELCGTLPQIHAKRFEHDELDGPGQNFATKQPAPLPINLRDDNPALALLQFVNAFDGRVLFVADSEGRRETILGLLKENNVKPVQYSNWREFWKADSPAPGITVAQLESGLLLDAANDQPALALICESQLFGQKARQVRRKARKGKRDMGAVIKELGDLTIGAAVVHEEHGIGRYLGLETIDTGGESAEYLTLQYADDNKLFVPVQSLELISRYTGANESNAPLHRLGSGVWEKAKRKAAQKARDVAAELLDVYAKRAASKGQSLPIDDLQYQAFCAAFPFEETEDQLKAIDAIVTDLATPEPMDRVVCGDVGFGKTEVAMRAAFVAANAGKQVAVLVPTTLLAQQHYENFLDRFANWPIKMDVISRFRTAKEKTQVLKGLADGTIDIVVGTHSLLQDKTKFKQLGLVIVDEEHRFGVRHKDQLKKLRAQVDLLTLTATPIPRTLNMAMSGLRDLSIIATPPSNRLAVQTFVKQWDDALIQEACLRELRRGGQVYFLHNKVENIEKITADLQELLPEVRIRFAHGQMREQELESTMFDFSHRRFDILVCTTIVESGIDVPNANTMIINRADRLGLAQLHQIRGRVGRSHHRAYCYMITPSPKLMTGDAQKRLEAIEALDDLGAGFNLAMHDLEIRGAGELLGEEQSGQIQEVGFSMYTELLDRAVRALKSGNMPELDAPLHDGPEVNMRLPTLLPADYVDDVHTRLIIYKRISGAEDSAALRELEVELIDRFGLLPDETKALFSTARMKITAKQLGIIKLEAWDSGGRILFNKKPNVDPMKILDLIQKPNSIYKFNGIDTLRFEKGLEDGEKRMEWVAHLMDNLRST